MPYVEVLAPQVPNQRKAALARSVTDGLMSAFGVTADTVTLYFLNIAPDDYAHAGAFGAQDTGQRILLKVHAFRRSEAERRAAAIALTRGVCSAYGVPGDDVAVYFIDRDRSEVSHDSKLASD
ncbi:tautomerase family protein [Bradyrhizobium sp. cf659]|uniref:tautomerase family protein n=1 Tax=Bradyrhizobium sp. cf659 TaxID=1761771 RepID=UPI0008E74E79|nr:tautomerase family protein [Bradyrhizobium sp. cf659]SFI05778.1 Phenylpyruvate tautomerase PptA, 4-oxalocrotonate tautomerase family [Bradyrhizobium sp. cf659]